MQTIRNSILQILLCLLAAASLGAEEFRTWNIIGGGQFEAKLNAVNGSSLALENRAGRVIDYPVGNLKPSDQKFARDWQLAQTTAEANPVEIEVERSAFAKRVYRDLVRSRGSRLDRFKPAPTDAPKYFAFYRSAMWCPPCRAFTPDLVEFYRKQKRSGAQFELIFISSDRSEDDMAEYMDEYEMAWPAFKHGENKDIVQRNGSGIPSLIITDADGNKLLDSYDSKGQYIGPKSVLADFEKLLAGKAI